MDHDEEIDVPPYFLCPISLEIMKDPVTVSTGITYDRQSIEKWIFSAKNQTCPVTNQIISDPDMIPNHTLRRLIQSWCTINSSINGIERFPTPKPPISRSQIMKIVSDAKSPHLQLNCLRKLKSIAAENETNKRSIEASGAPDFLASIVINATKSTNQVSEGTEFELAVSILYCLQLSESALRSLIAKNGGLLDSLSRALRGVNYESRTYAVLLLKSLLEVADPVQALTLRTEFFTQLLQILNDQISKKASKAALQLLVHVCPWGRNRIKAVEAGAVPILIDLLLDDSERRTCELALVALDLLCQCAEGREKLLGHGAGLAVVSKKILRVSAAASERAVRVLGSIARFSGSPSVVQEMLQVGVVAKLGVVLQVDCGHRTKEKAREILKLHARAWKNSPCIPMNLMSLYPS